MCGGIVVKNISYVFLGVGRLILVVLALYMCFRVFHFVDCGSEFWTALSALGTIGAVIVALFQEKLTRYFNRPKLKLSLVDVPVKCNLKCNVDEITYNGEAYYYNIKICNENRSAKADGCYVAVQSVEYDEKEYFKFEGDEPLNWRNSNREPKEIKNYGNPLEIITIGPEKEVNFLRITKWQGRPASIEIPTQKDVVMSGNGNSKKFTVTVQAKSNEYDSNVLKIEVNCSADLKSDIEKIKSQTEVKLCNGVAL